MQPDKPIPTILSSRVRLSALTIGKEDDGKPLEMVDIQIPPNCIGIKMGPAGPALNQDKIGS